ncbi:flagellar brake protein [Aquabacterium sp. A7-Y]|uniref:flagellar brake protein n=1 Tax=Aquabacterium sp. A7-Y TaxID=1349605 RepID=UPI00223D7726|nr:flagellar brake protein [Aquabacterium sp. A7-Y]MCW7540541.1 flagellar brake protein [Aquabacterium sp. A7-Y]
MVSERVLVTIATPGGACYTTNVWEVDRAKGVVRFTADRLDPQLSRVLDAEDAVAVAYLDSIKIQFDVHGLVQVHSGTRSSALNCSFPPEAFRFQRRASYRVRPLVNMPPTATFRHPAIPEMALELRVLDISIGGVALLIPENVPVVEPGVLVSRVQIDLDAETRLQAAVRVAHVTSMLDNSKGVRIGCELENLNGESLRLLQRFIDQTQKRRRMMALDGS